jgi:UDP-N-acetylmuramyl-tripeptide synthetase
MVENKVTHVVMEVSSIAIDLCRVEECFFDVGVFTNLTQDHLDYHKDMDTYWMAKKRFFTDVLTTGPKGRGAVAVINCNDAMGKDLFEKIKTNKISVGFSSSDMVASVEMSNTLNGIAGTMKTPLGNVGVSSSLVGAYNIENILCAAGAAVALQINPKAICSGVHATSYIPGRLDAVPNGLGRFVYVDYAHTPDALKNALETLDALKTGKIICVFGCGGNRDKSKRRPMGEIAGRICDLAVITTDNPRNEDPMEIIREIETGVKENAPRCFSAPDVKKGVGQKGYVVIPDRESAITAAIHASRAGDIVLIAGKGHETYQIVGNRTLAFDDKEVAQKVLQQLEARP